MSHIIRKSKYKGVWLQRYNGKDDKWTMKTYLNGRNVSKICETERQAAIAYDMVLIEKGKPPVNILKPK